MGETKTKILDAAERMTQTRGINGFSYLDLADEVGVKTSSIHYHFKTKSDLMLAMVMRIENVFGEGFDELQASIDSPQQRLREVVKLIQGYVKDDKFCLCGMMTAELQSVSEDVKARLKSFFKQFQDWLEKQFKEMKRKDAKGLAIGFMSGLEGSLLLARLHNDPKIVKKAVESYFSE
jgi:TetR/AcrR family transcriptional repressor of nem operon